MNKSHKGLTLMDRLLTSFERKGPDECWPWTGSKNKAGYGVFWMGRSQRPWRTTAHRILFMLRYGPIPEGLQGCHHCDNPSCVNPRHIFLGTHLDNAHDRDAKGRTASGVRHYLCKLTPDDVRSIDGLRRQGIPYRDIGKHFGVSSETAWYAHKRRTHKSVPA